MEDDEYIKNGKIEWKLKGTPYFQLIEKELNNLEELCEYALANNYELQITHS